jgi:protein TonB
MLAVPSTSGSPVAPERTPQERVPPGETTSREMLERSLEMARLEAQIRRDLDANQKRRRTEFVGARAAEYRFAAYVDNWRHKIERVGNLNYPADARQQRLYGTLQLTVVVRADGEVDAITLNRSSGHRALDEAAMRIVRLAAPFDRFPEAIRKDTDYISITRTWTFSRDDAMSAR